jgi:hypothetical protein
MELISQEFILNDNSVYWEKNVLSETFKSWDSHTILIIGQGLMNGIVHCRFYRFKLQQVVLRYMCISRAKWRAFAASDCSTFLSDLVNLS